MDNGDDSYWESHADEQDSIKEEALKAVKGFYAVAKIADDNGVGLNDDDKTQVSSRVESLIQQNFEGNRDKYNQALQESYMTEDLYNRILENSLFKEKVGSEMLNEKTGKYLITEDEMREILSKDYLRASHILLKTGTKDDAAQKAKAEEALEKAKAGEDFDELVKEYGEDDGMKDNTDGYYFTKGVMVEAFYNAAVGLKENEISGLVESNFGYHIIKRLPMETEYIDEHIDELISQHRQLLLQQEYEKAQNEMTVEYGEQYDQININSLK